MTLLQIDQFECPFCGSDDIALVDLDVVGRAQAGIAGLRFPTPELLVDLYWHCDACVTKYFRPTTLRIEQIVYLQKQLNVATEASGS